MINGNETAREALYRTLTVARDAVEEIWQSAHDQADVDLADDIMLSLVLLCCRCDPISNQT